VNINISEILVVLVVALLVIKPEQLPEVAFKMGKWMKSLRGAMTTLRRELDGTVTPSTPGVVAEKNETTNESRQA
jgi:Tat protein translocase TatB subunit